MQNSPADIHPDLEPQLRRFCLYGFLKNLQFFEPFLILVFLDRGLSFAQIGLLISFRAVCVNLLEVPSGAVADNWGRRRTMILSMMAYILSFGLFAVATSYAFFFLSMFFFSIGEACRTGTHKAMIFSWLTRHDLSAEKTRVYGLTRSWSKQGSSLNSIVAAAILILFRNYGWIFLLSIVPFTANVVNLWLYPKYLDEANSPARSGRGSLAILSSGIRLILSKRELSSLIAENICFEGIFSVVKDYLQPLLKIIAFAAPVLLSLTDRTRTAVLVAAVYFLLNQGSSVASRFSHKAVRLAGSEAKLGLHLWIIAAALYTAMLAGFRMELPIVSVSAFVVLFVTLNIWKPVFVSRFQDKSDLASAATTLSIANQSKTLAIAVAAPALGTLIDHTRAALSNTAAVQYFWPIAAAGVAASLLGILICLNRRQLGCRSTE